MREALDDQTLPVCFKGKKPFINMREVAKLFKPIALSFASDSGKSKAAAQFDISPEAYLVISVSDFCNISLIFCIKLYLVNKLICFVLISRRAMLAWGF